jgi:hypothetical protein
MVILATILKCEISKFGSNLGYKREQNFKECENKVDVHVKALEENNGKILSFACNDAS